MEQNQDNLSVGDKMFLEIVKNDTQTTAAETPAPETTIAEKTEPVVAEKKEVTNDKPAETKVEKTEKKDLFSKITEGKTDVSKEPKTYTHEEWEKAQNEWKSKIDTYESNKILKTMAEAMKAPNFDLKQFIKSFDEKQPMSLKEMVAAELKNEPEYKEYTHEELLEEAENELANKKTYEKNALEKALSEKYKPNDSETENPILKAYQEEAEAAKKEYEERKQWADNKIQYLEKETKSWVGEELLDGTGIIITAEMAEKAANAVKNPYEFYSKEGDYDPTAQAFHALIAMNLKDISDKLRKEGQLKAVEERTRPSESDGVIIGGGLDTDARPEDVKAMEAMIETGKKMFANKHGH